MIIQYKDLSAECLIYHPRTATAARGTYAKSAAAYLDTNREFPEIIGAVPDLAEFASGSDYNVGAFEIKAQMSRVVAIPKNLGFLLPAAALMISIRRRGQRPRINVR